jgi:hypothetical protein
MAKHENIFVEDYKTFFAILINCRKRQGFLIALSKIVSFAKNRPYKYTIFGLAGKF